MSSTLYSASAVADLEGPRVDRRRIAGIAVADLTREEAVAVLAARLSARQATGVGFLNAHCVNLAYARGDYRACLDHFLILPDGIGVDIAARVLFGVPFRDNLNGTDFLPAFLGALGGPKRVALVGGAPGIGEAAAARFGVIAPQHAFLPVSHGFFAAGAETEAVLAKLKDARPDIVLVALGVPAQELFIARHLGPEHGTLFFAVGALLDFMAGRVPRAPEAVRRLRAEWLWRLGLEPGRLWRRYILGNPLFLTYVLREKFARGRG